MQDSPIERAGARWASATTWFVPHFPASSAGEPLCTGPMGGLQTPLYEMGRAAR